MPSSLIRAARGRLARAAVAGCLLVAVGTLAGCGDSFSDRVALSAVQGRLAAPNPGAGLLGRGTIAGRVIIDTKGPAVFSVFTKVIPPGGTTGWHRHDGPETSVLTEGTLTFLRKGACRPVTYHAGDGVFVPANTPHLARNDGSEPAEIVVTYLLRPEAPDRMDTAPAC